MRDEIDARLWIEHGQHFSDDLDRLVSAVRATFRKLAVIQFRAPWRRPTTEC
jgi:hypothetical protein